MRYYEQDNNVIDIFFTLQSSYAVINKKNIIKLYNFISIYNDSDRFHCNKIGWIIEGNWIMIDDPSRTKHLSDLRHILEKLNALGKL